MPRSSKVKSVRLIVSIILRGGHNPGTNVTPNLTQVLPRLDIFEEEKVAVPHPNLTLQISLLQNKVAVKKYRLGPTPFPLTTTDNGFFLSSDLSKNVKQLKRQTVRLEHFLKLECKCKSRPDITHGSLNPAFFRGIPKVFEKSLKRRVTKL